MQQERIDSAQELNAPGTVGELLAKAGLPSLYALAKKIGYVDRHMTVFRILTGRTKHKPMITYRKVARALDRSEDELAKCLLDLSQGLSEKRFKEWMQKAGIENIHQLKIKADIGLPSAQQFMGRDHILLRHYRDIAAGLNISLEHLLNTLNVAPVSVSGIAVLQKSDKLTPSFEQPLGFQTRQAEKGSQNQSVGRKNWNLYTTAA